MAVRIEDIPNISTSDTGWIQYYKDLKASFGKRNAVSIWVKTWSARGGKNSNANSNTLRDYMEKQGVEIDAGGLAKIIDFGDDIVDTVTTVFKMGAILVFATIGISILGFSMILFNLAKEPAKNIGIAAGTAGKTMKGGL